MDLVAANRDQVSITLIPTLTLTRTLALNLVLTLTLTLILTLTFHPRPRFQPSPHPNHDQENQIFLAKDATSGVLDETSLSTAPFSTLALPYFNWPDGVLGAEWQES